MINLNAVNRQIHNSLLFLSPFIPPFACFLCTSVISDDVGSDGRRKFNASEHWACASSGPESQEDDSPNAGESNERSRRETGSGGVWQSSSFAFLHNTADIWSFVRLGWQTWGIQSARKNTAGWWALYMRFPLFMINLLFWSPLQSALRWRVLTKRNFTSQLYGWIKKIK